MTETDRTIIINQTIRDKDIDKEIITIIVAIMIIQEIENTDEWLKFIQVMSYTYQLIDE
jgi:hypothetical protein